MNTNYIHNTIFNLGYSVKWNSNSKHSEASQAVLHVILTNYVPDVSNFIVHIGLAMSTLKEFHYSAVEAVYFNLSHHILAWGSQGIDH